MLSYLRIRNLAIVKDVSLDFGPGLNLLTGETGAGKSILVDALGLALGDRAASDMVRAGETRAEIEAVFEIEGPAQDVRELLEAVGVGGEDAAVGEGGIVVRREIGEGSRSRQFLCDTPVALSTLRRFADVMVEIQGQHQHHALLAADSQREALDRYADLEAEARAVARLAQEANGARDAVTALAARVAERSSQLDYLRYQVQEIEALAPQPDEDARLRAERTLAAHAETRRTLTAGIYKTLYEDEDSVVGALARAAGEARRLAEIDPRFGAQAAGIEEALRLVEDVALEMRGGLEEEDSSPDRLDAIESRLAAFERIARKHGVEPARLVETWEDLSGRIAELEQADRRTEDAESAAREARAAYMARAKALSTARRAAAVRLAAEMRRALAALAMERSDVVVDVHETVPGAGDPVAASGLDTVQIRLSANPGEPPRPLADVASGGELSRIMLALNGVLGAKRRSRTLIFDEVDAGIGGKVAAVVGERLRALAASHQVIVITHLPQIASLADTHFAVEKRVERGRTVAQARELDREGRIAELARMMGGKEVTPLDRRHAEDLLRKSSPRAERRSP